MKNEEKLEKVKQMLDEKKIKHESHGRGFGHSDLWLPGLRIAIKLEGEDDVTFYDTHRKGIWPIFIREVEDVEFVIEKLENTIIKALTHIQRQFIEHQMALERKELRRQARAKKRKEAWKKRQALEKQRKERKEYKGRNMVRRDINARGYEYKQSDAFASAGTPIRRRRPRVVEVERVNYKVRREYSKGRTDNK